MQCTNCGYNLQPWDTACPQCTTPRQAAPPGNVLNPSGYYTPPPTQGVNRPTPAWVNTLFQYRPLKGLTVALNVFLCIDVLMDLMSAGSDLAQANLLQSVANGAGIPQDAALANDLRQAV